MCRRALHLTRLCVCACAYTCVSRCVSLCVSACLCAPCLCVWVRVWVRALTQRQSGHGREKCRVLSCGASFPRPGEASLPPPLALSRALSLSRARALPLRELCLLSLRASGVARYISAKRGDEVAVHMRQCTHAHTHTHTHTHTHQVVSAGSGVRFGHVQFLARVRCRFVPSRALLSSRTSQQISQNCRYCKCHRSERACARARACALACAWRGEKGHGRNACVPTLARALSAGERFCAVRERFCAVRERFCAVRERFCACLAWCLLVPTCVHVRVGSTVYLPSH